MDMPSALPRGTTAPKMSRRTLAGLVAIVVAAIALFLAMRGGQKAERGNDRAAGGDNAASARPGGSGVGSGVGAPRPRVRIDDGTGTATGGAGARGDRTYVTDTGNLVRDHRDHVREDVAVPAPLPPEQRTMSSTITGDLLRQLAPIVRGCGVDVPADARGESPVVHVTLMVDVAGEKLTATDATAVTSDVTGLAADKVLACVRDRAAALTVPAKGEPDRSGYVVQYPIRIR
jgi:hypothetical protein